MSFSPHKKRVAILRGGPSAEYEESLRTGRFVLENLPEEFEPVDIFIDREGVWHLGGLAIGPHKALSGIDVVWNALHGEFGEDGRLQRIVADFGLPLVGSGQLASAFGLSKNLAKKVFERAGLKTPIALLFDREQEAEKIADQVFGTLPFPVVVKPERSGSSRGIKTAQTRAEVLEALEEAFKFSPKILVEEFIEGKEVVSGVIEGFRGEPNYTLLPHSVSTLSESESKLARELAINAHQALGLEDFSEVDLIIHPRRGAYILEVNTSPKLHNESPFVQSLKSAGADFKEFLAHTLNRILGRK